MARTLDRGAWYVKCNFADAAQDVDALDYATFRLHALKGDLKGFWSLTVRANWRVIFRFEGGAASEVDLVDYH